MSDITCSACGVEYDMGNHPDLWCDGSQRFDFDCDCGAVLTVEVDWSPSFHVQAVDTTKKKESES